MRFFTKSPRVLLMGIVALALSLTIPAALAFASPADDKQAEADAAYEQLQEMQTAYEQAEADYETAIDAQMKAEAAVADAQTRINAATERISKLQSILSKRARTMYRSGDLTMMDLLFGATTFEEFANNWDLLGILNQNDADMIQEAKDLKKEIETQKVILVEQQKIATQKAEEAAKAVEAAQAVVEEMRSVYESLSEEAAELLAQEQAAAAAYAAINAGSNTGSNSNNTSGNYQNDYSGLVNSSAVVARAQSLLGGSYEWGGVGPDAFDCSGFVSYCLTGVYSRLGSTHTMIGWPEVSDPQPGDVCVNSGHCGIYIGGGQMIHAASEDEGIIVGPVQGGMIYVRY